MPQLTSPGVSVTVVDQSQYLPAPTASTPLIVFATAQNKADPTSTGVATGTTAANAGKMYQITSQRDLVTTFGNPFFYTTTNGTPIQGYELNEYGLLAAYSALGVTNRVYAVRADIDLASLVGKTGRPTGAPADGAWWLDTSMSTWGIYEFDAVKGVFNLQTPIVITNPVLITGGHFPSQSLGNVGDYAVIATPTYAYPLSSNSGMFFKKDQFGVWQRLGTEGWLRSVPTVQGTVANPTLTPGNTFTIAVGVGKVQTITVQASPNNVVSIVASDINSLPGTYVNAAVVNGKLTIYSAITSNYDTSTYITLGAGSPDALAQLGLTAGNYTQPLLQYGTSAQQPLWQVGQSFPRPSGSVWMKIGEAGNGLTSYVNKYDSVTSNWKSLSVSYATDDWSAISQLDATGGAAIPADTVYAQYFYDGNGRNTISPVYYWKRLAAGATIITASSTPDFVNGPYYATVQVTLPGSTYVSSSYNLTVPDNATANDFAVAWGAAAIPFTKCTVLDTGELQLTHTAGGAIVINDFLTGFGSTNGYSNGLTTDAGFIIGTTLGVKEGLELNFSYIPAQFSTSGSGTGFIPKVYVKAGTYTVTQNSFSNAGSNYAVGDTITISGAALGGTHPTNDLVIKVAATNPVTTAVTYVEFESGVPANAYSIQLSNWVEFDMAAGLGAPTARPSDMTNWFYSVVDQVDIMIRTSTGWKGYRNSSYDRNGFPITGTNHTDVNGPIISASEPTTQSDGVTALHYGDIWIDTSDLENYPMINRWQQVDGVDMWVTLDNTDQTGSTGVLFADARWSTNQNTINAYDDPISSIKSLLSSNNLDLDAPSYTLYPVGMLLFNSRRSGYNVKAYRRNYFNSLSFPNQSIPSNADTWVTESGLQANGSAYMGRKAQRAMVVKALRVAMDTSSGIRDEDNDFNLISCPGYTELQPNMVTLNNDRGDTAFIVGDTPFRLAASGTAIQAWATNAAGATSSGEDGLVTRDTYMGLFYPSGIASDLSGNLVAVPSSHMMIRTILRNDTVAYPWFAPAGTRRGIIDNATNIGYIDAMTGEFQTIKTNIGLRDTLYINYINPMVYFTGNGLLNYGNKGSYASQSALDRINVARLIAYIRKQLTIAARPFVFEPNDKITRDAIAGVVQTLFVDLVAKRGIYDFLVVCDESNNTPARIDRNELWVDVAIEPVKAAEFIYIPIRVLNTGAIGNK